MNLTKTVIISPSGNFYGSEQVLFDFLTETNHLYTVFAPSNGRLIEKLIFQKKHKILPFHNLKLLYVKIFFLLLLGKANTVYCNEGGHIRYLKLLARIFNKIKFIIHIRIIEDTKPSRVGILPGNILLISISEYVSSFLGRQQLNTVRTIYDPYLSSSKNNNIKVPIVKRVRAGVIGRVTNTKGLSEVESFCDFLERNDLSNIEINLIGDVERENNKVARFEEKSKSYKKVKVIFHGFVDNKNDIYEYIDIVLHFSKVEPLGRIFFESLDHGLPIIGFNEGGMGEIARLLSIQDCMVDNGADWQESLYKKIVSIEQVIHKYQSAKEMYPRLFSPAFYCKEIEKIIL